MIHKLTCPACRVYNVEDQVYKHDLADHMLSFELFDINRCSNCGLLRTVPGLEIENIEKYYKSEKYYSHSKENTTLFSFLYQTARKWMLIKKRRFCSRFIDQGAKVLDVGTGSGGFALQMKEAGHQVMAYEPNAYARQQIPENAQIDMLADESALHAVKEGSLDMITAWHVLEHIPDFDDKLVLFRRSLQKKGVLIIAVPLHTSFDARFYGNWWAGWDVPRHLYHFDRASLEKAANTAGFKLIQRKPMPLDAFYVSLLSESYLRSWPAPFSQLRALGVAFLSNTLALLGVGSWSSEIFVFRPGI